MTHKDLIPDKDPLTGQYENKRQTNRRRQSYENKNRFLLKDVQDLKNTCRGNRVLTTLIRFHFTILKDNFGFMGLLAYFILI